MTISYIGLDVHKKYTTIAIYTTEDAQTGSYRVLTENLVSHIATLSSPKRIALETSADGMRVARELRAAGHDVIVVDAFKAHRLLDAFATSKTDKIDAQLLALLLAKDALDFATVWVPTEQIHHLRQLVRSRKGLKEQGTAVRNQIRSLLGQEGHDCPYTNLCGKGAKEWLDDIADQLPPTTAQILSSLRTTIESLEAQVDQLDKLIDNEADHYPQIALLSTIPGIGPILGATIVAEIGDIARFDTVKNLRSYSGLVPDLHQSGEHEHTGPLVKGGNKLLRWALIEAAGGFSRSKKTDDLTMVKNFHAKVYAKGPKPARAALARHLCDVIFAMWRDGTLFDPCQLHPHTDNAASVKAAG